VNVHLLDMLERNEKDKVFARWAEQYDSEGNPLLTLEERYLRCMLPELKGRDVLDVGCGTGRWLRQLERMGARTVVGVDSTREMLEFATWKSRRARLMLGDAEHLPLRDRSVHVVICSFVLSYVDLNDCIRELRRVTRPGARVFVSDVHAGTAATLGWRRAFRARDESVELPARSHDLDSVVDCFEREGFRVRTLVEPRFGAPEQRQFECAGKGASYRAAEGHPAIYLLEVERRPVRSTVEVESPSLAITRAQCALGPAESVPADVCIRDGRVESLQSRTGLRAAHEIKLGGYLLLPGLINAHDHLEFALFPRLGAGHYQNSAHWADDIQSREAKLIARHRSVSKTTRLWWGALRNLLCGVTTVCHHNPVSPEMLDESFPVRVLPDLAWAHSLHFDESRVTGVIEGDRKSPFVLHLGEGVDAGSEEEIFELNRRGGLDGRTVVVHGTAFSEPSLQLLNESGAALVWCPGSSRFLFGRTHKAEFLRKVKRLALGSDSALTSEGDLLDEVRIAAGAGVAPEELFAQVTTSAAEVFHLEDSRGRIRVDGPADLVAVRDTGNSPAERLAEMSFRDVELVLVSGRVHLASAEMMSRLPEELSQGLRPIAVEGEARWVRAPLGHLFKDAVRELGCDIRLGGKSVEHISTSWL
jgi:cytosine/adenosine deaminase-related metal-dependent hydrolase/ubiquinone/menaquinone biosynthesis C-methylase UbiE